MFKWFNFKGNEKKESFKVVKEKPEELKPDNNIRIVDLTQNDIVKPNPVITPFSDNGLLKKYPVNTNMYKWRF